MCDILQAANMLRGVPKEIAEMKNELENIEEFINKADRMVDDVEDDNTSQGIKAKIKQLIEASFGIQDVIDEYMICEEKPHGCAGGANLAKTMILRHRIANKIRNIKSQISEMNDARRMDHSFHIQSSLEQGSSSSTRNLNAALLQNLRKAPFYMDEADIVGFEMPRDMLIDWKKGCIVPSKILIRQWMAERFVKEDMEKTLEEVAKGYLAELINRSLVQVVSVSIDGRAKSCCVHDLVYAMIVEKCADLSFCKNINDDDQSSLSGMVRRLSIATKSDNLMESIESSQVRSLLVKTLNESFARRIPTKYKRLNMLDLEHVGLLNVPKDLGCLTHLKYFRFRENFRGNRCVLPKAIGMLENLETLDLTRTSFEAMPKEICKLRKLRHFLGYNMSLIQLKDGIGGMTSLQTLRDVYLEGGENEIVKLIQELGKLKQLKELVLIGVRSTYMSAISSSINEMQQMEKLHIRANGYNTVIDMNLSSPPPMLRHLTLDGKLEMLPEWIPKLQNLVKLNLKYSQLTDDKMKLLKSMPNLLSLSLRENAYEAERLHFQDGWFKNLKHLYLEDLENLNYIIIDEGALRSLEKLQLTFIRHLKTLPTGIQHLKKLEVLSIKQMSHLFSEDFFFDEGKAHWSFKHVPVIDI
ncbi:hypothetical protein P8452_19965 [Trifolium repens]|nr:hypothetical protein P8452_19965 [Trifolium repens]